MRRCLVILCVAVLASSISAVAWGVNFGNVGGTWFANNSSHKFWYSSALNNQFRAATEASRVESYGATDLTTSMVATDDAADVGVFSGTHGLNNVHGYYQCVVVDTITPNSCRHGHVVYNESYLPTIYTTTARRRSLACEEIGHSVGLLHETAAMDQTQDYGCMARPVDYDQFIRGHNVGHINGRY